MQYPGGQKQENKEKSLLSYEFTIQGMSLYESETENERTSNEKHPSNTSECFEMRYKNI